MLREGLNIMTMECKIREVFYCMILCSYSHEYLCRDTGIVPASVVSQRAVQHTSDVFS